MAGITHADLLAVQEAVTKTVRHEVGQAREEFKQKFAELRELHDERKLEVERQGREIARLDERTKLTSRGLFGSLSTKQKAAVWSAAIAGAGVVLDGLRHVAVMVFTLWAKGVRP